MKILKFHKKLGFLNKTETLLELDPLGCHVTVSTVHTH